MMLCEPDGIRINSYKPRVPFLGPRQTVRSDQGLHCLLTENSII